MRPTSEGRGGDGASAGGAAATSREWALAAGLREIEAAEAAGDLRPVDGGWAATLRGGEPVVFRRLYAGAEFCRHLIPTRSQWAAVLAFAAQRGVPVTLRTPPAAEDDLPRLDALLGELAGRAGAEGVASDWGTLRLLRRRFPAVRPILGRCLRREKKDPRVHDLPRTGALAEDVVALLAHFGVDLLEADWLPDDASPVPLAMHLPFAFVASGSLCPTSGLNRPVEEKFRPDQPCQAPCRGLAVWLHHRATREPFLLRENTVFAPNAAFLPATARPDVARLVYDLDTDLERTFLRPGGAP